MFCGEATAYWLSGPFRIKMMLIIVAIAFGAVVNQNAAAWGKQQKISTGVKVVALISMLLWIVTILARQRSTRNFRHRLEIGAFLQHGEIREWRMGETSKDAHRSQCRTLEEKII